MCLRNRRKGHKHQKNRNNGRRRRNHRWLKKRLKKLRRKRLEKGEEVFSPITKLMKRGLKGCFPFASDVDQDILWLIMVIVTPADIAVSRGISRLKLASDTCLNLEISIGLGR
jgi:hypothetical protein